MIRSEGIGVRYLLAVVITLTAFSTCTAAYAEKKVALVIGNSAYQNANRLRNPANDARAMAQLFKDLGFEVKLVLDADRASLTSVLGDFSQLATGSDAAIFYYAGHGLSLDNRNFLVPVDSDIQRATDVRLGAAVDAEVAIEQALADAKVKLVFLDACRNNPFVDQIKRSIGSTRAASVSSGLAEMKSGEGTLIAFSTAPGQTALDGDGELSPFAEAMLKELAEPGLEVRLAMTKVRADVERSTMSQQTPWESTNLTGFFYFKPTAPELPKVTAPIPSSPDTAAELDLEYWKSVKDSENPSLIRSYLVKFPNGVYRLLAETRLQQLEQSAPATEAKTEIESTSADVKQQPALPSNMGIQLPSEEMPDMMPLSNSKLIPEKTDQQGDYGNTVQKTVNSKPKPIAVRPEKTIKSTKKTSVDKVAIGSSNDAAMLSKFIRLNAGVWSLPAGASKLGPKAFTRSFVVVYKGRQYSCRSRASGGGSNRVSCNPR